MFAVYVTVTLANVAYNLFSAVLDFVRFPKILEAMAKAGVPSSWLPALGALKAAGAVGLLIGFVIAPLGTAAAIGIVGFFAGAVIVHLRARDYSFGLQYVFLPLAIAGLAVRPFAA